MPTQRCNFYVIDLITNRSRKCKNKKNKLNCLNKYCFLHNKLLYNKYIILIQSIFRGNKIRHKLNIIYNRLPEDLQIKIINICHEHKSYIKFKNKINNIINSKINNIINIERNYNIPYIFSEMKIVSHSCYLLNKYYGIYCNYNNYNNINSFYKIVRQLIDRHHLTRYDYNYNILNLIAFHDLYFRFYKNNYIFL